MGNAVDNFSVFITHKRMSRENQYIEHIKRKADTLSGLEKKPETLEAQREVLRIKLEALVYTRFGYDIEEWLKPVTLKYDGILYTFAKNIECELAHQHGNTVTTEFRKRHGVEMTEYTNALIGPPKRTFQSIDWSHYVGIYTSADTQKREVDYVLK